MPKERERVVRRVRMGNMERPKTYNAIPVIRYLQHMYAETREQTVLGSGEMDVCWHVSDVHSTVDYC